MSPNGIPQRYILVVDDEPNVRQVVHMMLKLDGHRVAEAEDGPQALAQFEPGKFDLVLTDYCMPRMTGDQLAAAIKKRSPEQPVVMLTACPEQVRALDHLLTAVDLLIGKPFGIENLREAVAMCSPVQKLEFAT
jgi:CheY-like chemotaxis protein